MHINYWGIVHKIHKSLEAYVCLISKQSVVLWILWVNKKNNIWFAKFAKFCCVRYKSNYTLSNLSLLFLQSSIYIFEFSLSLISIITDVDDFPAWRYGKFVVPTWLLFGHTCTLNGLENGLWQTTVLSSPAKL